MRPPAPPASTLRLLPAVLVIATTAGGALFMAGCSGDSGRVSIQQSGSGSPVATAASSTRPSEENEPMTPFEKRRLIARLKRDPNALGRLSPRERREVAAMLHAARGDDETRD